MRVLFAGGGTAGHINPAIAVANYIKEQEPNSKFLFVGTKEGMEESLVPRNGFDIKFIKVYGFERKISFNNAKNLINIIKSIRTSKKIIKDFKPDIVMGTGGYVTGPVLYAAAKMKIPTIVHESNAFPGATIRILSRYVDVVALGMKDAARFLKSPKRLEVTGNPIRPAILKENAQNARKKLGIDSRPMILIFGGSLGATQLNKVIVDWLSKILGQNKYNILMSTGKNNQYDMVIKRLKDNGVDLEKNQDTKVSEYIYDMELALNACDLIIARSGSSVSEMNAVGKPAVLIPSPNVAGNHQEYNARAVEKAGAAVVILEKDLNADLLGEKVREILDNPKKLTEMKEKSKEYGIIDATKKIYDIMRELVHTK